MDRITDTSVAETDKIDVDINNSQKNKPLFVTSSEYVQIDNCREKGDNPESAPEQNAGKKDSDGTKDTPFGSSDRGDAESADVEDRVTPKEEVKVHSEDVVEMNYEKSSNEKSVIGSHESQIQIKDHVDAFALISEQLNFLNNESGVLTTHIHKSDGQMQEEKGKQAVKRRLDTGR